MLARQVWKQCCEINAAITVVLVSSAAAPDQANARIRLLTQLLCPVFSLVLTGLQIGNGIGDRVESRLECQRQRQQRAMIVKGRQRCALFYNFANASKPLEQSDEPLRHLKDDMCACFSDQFCVTAKLYRIAQTLLTMQQYCSVLQRFPTEPKRLNEVALAFSSIIFLPSPLIKV